MNHTVSVTQGTLSKCQGNITQVIQLIALRDEEIDKCKNETISCETELQEKERQLGSAKVKAADYKRCQSKVVTLNKQLLKPKGKKMLLYYYTCIYKAVIYVRSVSCTQYQLHVL